MALGATKQDILPLVLKRSAAVKRLSLTILGVTLSVATLAQSDTAVWVVWTRSHHFPIASIVSASDDDYADLQFLKAVVGDRRLVQLGESGHGVAEFDSAKVRLITFFHEQMGFDVMAFESSIYECFAANTVAGMADNLSVLARDLYPDRKILIWAHNFHIRHANESTALVQRTMGGFIAERFRPELYTIGLYMNQGTAAQNDRTIYVIRPAPSGSMEWVLASAGPAALFVDLLHQTEEPGNVWMFQPIVTREWGVSSLQLVPRDQYDGVLFIDRVKSPNYVRF